MPHVSPERRVRRRRIPDLHSSLPEFLRARETAAGVVRHVLVDAVAIRLLFLLSAVSGRHFQGHCRQVQNMKLKRRAAELTELLSEKENICSILRDSSSKYLSNYCNRARNSMLGWQHGQDCSSNVHALGVGTEHNYVSGLIQLYKKLQKFHAIYSFFRFLWFFLKA